MLYPKEDRNNNKLMFACRTCQFSEEAISSCVFRNNLYNTVGETAGVTQDVGSDPTVGLPYFCTLCGQEIECLFCGGMNDDSQMEDDVMEDDISIEESESDLEAELESELESELEWELESELGSDLDLEWELEQKDHSVVSAKEKSDEGNIACIFG